MIDKNLLATMMASADQALAHRQEEIRRLVQQYQALRARGRDSMVASGLVVFASIATLDQISACQLLGAAVAMLAEKPEAGEPSC